MSKRNVIFIGNCFTLITWVDDFDGDDDAVIHEANEIVKAQTGFDVLAASQDVEVEYESGVVSNV